MRCLFIIILLSLSFSTFSQSGFSEIYDMNTPGISFQNAILKDNNIIVTGSVKFENQTQLDLIVVEMDTLGNVLNHQTFSDSLGAHMVQNPAWPVIITQDGGCLISGGYVGRDNNFLIKLDENGVQEFFVDYDTPSNVSIKIMETDNHYYIFGSGQQVLGKNEGNIKKINKQGALIWERYYGKPNQRSVIFSAKYIDENEIILGAGLGGHPYGSPWSYNDDWSRSWLMAIDSLGNIKWEWEGEKNETGAIRGLQILDNGDYLYGTLAFYIFEEVLANGGTVKLFRQAPDFSIVWEKEISPPSFAPAIYDIRPTPDGNWMAYGKWFTLKEDGEPGSLNAWLGSCLYKFDEDGEEIWTRCDTVAMPDFYDDILGGMVTLPSGSIIRAGSVNDYQNVRSYGWVVKVDANGCIDTLCNLSTAIEELFSQEEKLKIYPNPATDQLTISYSITSPLKSKKNTIKIIDAQGRLIETQKWKEGATTLQISVKDYPKGLYFLQFLKDGIMIETERFLIH